MSEKEREKCEARVHNVHVHKGCRRSICDRRHFLGDKF